MFITLQQKLKRLLARFGPYTWYMLHSANKIGEHKKRLVTLQNINTIQYNTIHINTLNVEFMNSTGLKCECNKSLFRNIITYT